MEERIITHILELIKCSIGVGVAVIFYRIMLSLEIISRKEQGAIKTSYWIKVHGKIIVILVTVIIGIILYNIFDSKQSNYRELWEWKGKADMRIEALENNQ